MTTDETDGRNDERNPSDDVMDHPCMRPRLVHREDVQANDYNPNRVPDPELDLLEKSIRADGMTMPIVVYQYDDESYEIVDGFHRFLVLTDRIGEDWIPVSVLDRDDAERMASTVRHNRARGDHATELMGQLLQSMEEKGMGTGEIAAELGMEDEEVVRLKQVVGASEMLAADEYGQSWGVQDDGGDDG